MWQERWHRTVGTIRVIHNPEEEGCLLDELATGGAARVLGFVNAYAMNSIVANGDFYEALVTADILLRDGSGMALLYRKLGVAAGLNMNGTDFIPKILAAFRGRRVVFWGTEEPFLGIAAGRSEAEFGVQVVSRHHGFENVDFYVQLTERLKPDLVVLGMGMPKQERVARRIRDVAGGAPLVVCGGAIIDFLGGKVSRAPAWMHRLGIEWVYRLLREPKRLFKRYVVGNPTFILRVARWRKVGGSMR